MISRTSNFDPDPVENVSKLNFVLEFDSSAPEFQITKSLLVVVVAADDDDVTLNHCTEKISSENDFRNPPSIHSAIRPFLQRSLGFSFMRAPPVPGRRASEKISSKTPQNIF